MKEEICAAASFLTRLVGKNAELSAQQVEVFRNTLGVILMEKFQGHWFPEKPCKGQAYRCIRVNGRERRDPVLEQAAEMCGLRYENLSLPVELTVWVDPQEVCCRFGEDEGSYCTVASFKDNKENLSDNVVEEIHLKSPHQNSPECQKKHKNRRKPVEKQKKQSSSRNSVPHQGTQKGFNPKTPLINTKGFPCHLANYFDWNLATSPFPARFNRLDGSNFRDLPLARRPRKAGRTNYTDDRYHWARK